MGDVTTLADPAVVRDIIAGGGGAAVGAGADFAYHVHGSPTARAALATGMKDQARKLLDTLPEDSTWDDLMRAIYERLMVEEGIADFEVGRTVSNQEVRRRFGLPA